MAKFTFKDTGKEIKVGDTFFVIQNESYHINGGGRQYRDVVIERTVETVGLKYLNKGSRYYGLHIDEYNTTDYKSIFSLKESCEFRIKINLLKDKIYKFCQTTYKVRALNDNDILAIAQILKITDEIN